MDGCRAAEAVQEILSPGRMSILSKGTWSKLKNVKIVSSADVRVLFEETAKELPSLESLEGVTLQQRNTTLSSPELLTLDNLNEALVPWKESPAVWEFRHL